MKTSDLAILAAAGLAVVALLKYAGVIGSKTSGAKYDQAYLERYGLGAYLAATGEDPPAGVTIGSLFNTGLGGGYLTGPVSESSLFHTGATAGLF